jgi:hypothetical protein
LVAEFPNKGSHLAFAATIFGQLWRLEPLPPEKKAMWRREMDWLLCVSDHIVELVPTWQSFPDGTRLEVYYLAFGNLHFPRFTFYCSSRSTSSVV